MQILLHNFKTMQIRLRKLLPCKLQEPDFRYTTIPWHSKQCRFCFIILKQCRFSFVSFFLVNSRNPILGTQRYKVPSSKLQEALASQPRISRPVDPWTRALVPQPRISRPVDPWTRKIRGPVDPNRIESKILLRASRGYNRIESNRIYRIA